MGNAGARLGLTVGLGLVGAFFGGGTGFAIGAMAGSIAGNFLFPIEQPDITSQGPRLEDLTVQTSTYGNAIPLLWGVMRIAGNVIWSTKIIETANTESRQVGGKGGGGGQTQTSTTFSYSASFAIGLCRGPIIGIKRIWADDKLWFDFTNPPVGVSFNYQLYLGTETQLPDPTIEADKGAGNVPAYRGLAYIVFTDLALKEFGNRVPNFHFEVVADGYNTVTATYASDGGNYTTGRVAIDPETGLIWATRQQDPTYGVRVYRPDTMEEVYHLDVSGADGISYQPPFMYATASQFEGIAIHDMPPRMYVNQSGFTNGASGAKGYVIETRTYNTQTVTPFDPNLIFPFLGIPIVDLDSIPDTVATAMTDNPLVLWTIGSGIFSGISREPIVPALDIANAINTDWNPSAQYPALTNLTIADAVNGGNCLYFVNTFGQLFRMQSGTYDVDALVQPVNAGGSSGLRLAYDVTEDTVYLMTWTTPSGTWALYKYSSDLATQYWTKTVDQISSGGASLGGVAVHPTTGELWVYATNGTGNRVVELDKTDGSTLQELVISNGSGLALSDFKIYPDSLFAIGSKTSNPSGVVKIPLVPGPTPDGVPLSQIVSDISLAIGMSAADIDVTDLATESVQGFVVAQRGAARASIESLMRAYFFDGVESDYKARFILRGNASSRTIAYGDLAAHQPDAEVPAPREATRTEENELPNQIDVRYFDQASFYKINDQYDRRLIGATKEAVTVDVPIVLTADQAKQIAVKHLYLAWMERNKARVRISAKYLAIDPTDVVTILDENGVASECRLTSVQFSPPNLIEAECVVEEVSLYTSLAVGVPASPPAQTVIGVVPTILYVLDIPVLRDRDDGPGVYVGVAPSYDGWTYAEVYKSSDGNIYNGVQFFDASAVTGATVTSPSWTGSIY